VTLRKIKEAKKLSSKEVKATKWVKEKEYSFGIKKKPKRSFTSWCMEAN
jgi:isopentenyldiphosphate isomerase